MVASGSRTMIAGSLSSSIAVSGNSAGSHNYPARDPCALAQGGLSLLLALEVARSGRATTDRDRSACADPADECREPALGRATHPRRTAQARV